MRLWHMPRFVISVPPWLLRRVAVLYSRLLPRVMLTPQLLDLLAISRVTQIGNTWSYFGVRHGAWKTACLAGSRATAGASCCAPRCALVRGGLPDDGL